MFGLIEAISIINVLHLSSVTENLLLRMVGSHTSAQTQKDLKVCFTSYTKAKISQFKTQLQNTRKDDSSVAFYLLKIKSSVDLLPSVGHSSSNDDYIEETFDGLPSKYDRFITSVKTRMHSYGVDEIE